MKDRRERNYPLFRNLWNRRIGERRLPGTELERWMRMPANILLRRLKEKFIRWYNT